MLPDKELTEFKKEYETLKKEVNIFQWKIDKIIKFVNIFPVLHKIGYILIFNALLLLLGQTFQITKEYWMPIDLFIMCTNVSIGVYLISQREKIEKPK